MYYNFTTHIFRALELRLSISTDSFLLSCFAFRISLEANIIAFNYTHTFYFSHWKPTQTQPPGNNNFSGFSAVVACHNLATSCKPMPPPGCLIVLTGEISPGLFRMVKEACQKKNQNGFFRLTYATFFKELCILAKSQDNVACTLFYRNPSSTRQLHE